MINRIPILTSRKSFEAMRSEIQRLRTEIRTFELELDELRRDSLRVAEMLDLVEQHLTPAATPHSNE